MKNKKKQEIGAQEKEILNYNRVGQLERSISRFLTTTAVLTSSSSSFLPKLLCFF